MKFLVIQLIKLYQNKKPSRWQGFCIYEPSCSQYGIMAIQKFGLIKGLIKTIKRIKRCDHKHEGGIDFP